MEYVGCCFFIFAIRQVTTKIRAKRLVKTNRQVDCLIPHIRFLLRFRSEEGGASVLPLDLHDHAFAAYKRRNHRDPDH